MDNGRLHFTCLRRRPLDVRRGRGLRRIWVISRKEELHNNILFTKSDLAEQVN